MISAGDRVQIVSPMGQEALLEFVGLIGTVKTTAYGKPGRILVELDRPCRFGGTESIIIAARHLMKESP